MRICKGSLYFWFPSTQGRSAGATYDQDFSKIALSKKPSLIPPVRFERARVACFFERAIYDQFWSSTALRCSSLRFHVFLAPAHYGDLQLTGTKTMLPLTTK